MATVSFLYRSTKPEAFLNIRLLFRHDDNDYQIGGKSKIKVSKEYWKNHHDKTRIRDIDIKNQQTEVNNKISDLENYILDAFDIANPDEVNKQWLKNIVSLYYNPQEELPEIPKDLISFIDYYLELKQSEIKVSKYKRLTTTKNKMLRLQKELGHKILIAEINEDFKNKYIDFSNKHSYSKNTQQRELARIKTICSYAKYLGLDTHYQLDKLKMKRETVKHPYLNFDELEIIKNQIFDKDYLDNARDWLLISCYTGQRVSDFMRFTSDMIEQDEDGYLMINFTQEKTGKDMELDLLDGVKEILNKRDGQFPRPISDQKYNDYIKEVCKQCGFDEIIKGKKRICIAPENMKPTKYDYRDVSGEFPKHKLITSHIGRRSFATNYYGKVDTYHLIQITGHSSERMFLNYIQRGSKQKSKDAGKALRKANKKLKSFKQK